MPSDAMTIGEAIRLAREYQSAGKFDQAISIYTQLALVLPADQTAAVQNNLGMALKGAGRIEEAIAAYRRAVTARPESAAALSNLGNVLKETGQIDEAIEVLDHALAIDPGNAMTVNNRGSALESAGRIDEAIAAYERAVSLDPNLVSAFDNLVYAMHFSPRFSATDILLAHKRWAKQYAEPLRSNLPNHANDRSSNRRLKIGYVSADLREHVVGRFMLPLIEHHDHSQFEVFCYSNTLTPPNAMTEKIRSHADHWRNIAALDDAAAAAQIISDRIDILIDLSLHMAGNRMQLFARKPAPVQATYLAYASTSGMDAIDYRITDSVIDPIDSDDSIYTERSIRLAKTYWCYQPAMEAGITPVNREANQPITFGCLNNFSKCSIDAQTAWREILKNVDGSRLILHANAGKHCEAVFDCFAADGIARSRVKFFGHRMASDYYATYQQIDIALDPFPYGGGTTSCDALWMGVPIVTLRGQTAVGRGGGSILTNLGLPELIAENVDQYIDLAITLAKDRARLQSLRASLRKRMEKSPLMNAPQFARDFESALRKMWAAFCEE